MSQVQSQSQSQTQIVVKVQPTDIVRTVLDEIRRGKELFRRVLSEYVEGLTIEPTVCYLSVREVVEYRIRGSIMTTIEIDAIEDEDLRELIREIIGTYAHMYVSLVLHKTIEYEVPKEANEDEVQVNYFYRTSSVRMARRRVVLTEKIDDERWVVTWYELEIDISVSNDDP